MWMELIRRLLPRIEDDIPESLPPLEDFPDLTPAAAALSRAQAKSYLAAREVTDYQVRRLAGLELLGWKVQPIRGRSDAEHRERERG
jgi:hypothetical protein